ncbi:MAG: glycosyltransferase [Planctomycetota bacterium]|nr:glycosyltransferase [Planctomycetota bacterium]
MIEFDELVRRLRHVKPSLAEGLAPAIDRVRSMPPAMLGRELGASLPPTDGGGPPTPSIDPTLPVFIMGAGRGGVLRGLLAPGGPDRPFRRCVVVETDPMRMLATLLRDDWSAALADERIRFAVGPGIGDAVRAALPDEIDPLLEPALRPRTPVLPADSGVHVASIASAFKRTVLGHANEFLGRCRSQGERRDSEPNPLRRDRWRIFSSVGETTTALKHLAPAILSAASRRGHEGLVDEVDPTSPFSGSRLSRRSFDVDPDLVLSFLKPGRTLAPWRNRLPGIVLVSSNPHLLPIESFEWSERDLVVLADPSFEPAYRRLGLDPVVRPLGTEVPDLEEDPREVTLDCDVRVVGSLPDATMAVGAVPPPAHERLRALAREWVAHPAADPVEILGRTPFDFPEPLRPKLGLALAYEATRLRRIRSAVILAESGLRVRIHGDASWRGAIAGTAADGHWHGWLAAGAEQFEAFRRAGVTINVNQFAAPGMLNMRSLEVPAAGGVLVTDDRPVLHRSFQVGREVLSFDRLEELPGLVGDVLRDRDRRDAIAAAGRARVEREHSWDAWWAWVEQELRSRFG